MSLVISGSWVASWGKWTTELCAPWAFLAFFKGGLLKTMETKGLLCRKCPEKANFADRKLTSDCLGLQVGMGIYVGGYKEYYWSDITVIKLNYWLHTCTWHTLDLCQNSHYPPDLHLCGNLIYVSTGLQQWGKGWAIYNIMLNQWLSI
jgi:hypothetical protein